MHYGVPDLRVRVGVRAGSGRSALCIVHHGVPYFRVRVGDKVGVRP